VSLSSYECFRARFTFRGRIQVMVRISARPVPKVDTAAEDIEGCSVVNFLTLHAYVVGYK